MKILVLLSNRQSNNNQAESVANIISDHYFSIKLQFTWFIKFPNFIKLPLSLLIKNYKEVSEFSKDCNIVISCGRQSARMAVDIKKSNQKNGLKTKVIQILNPNLSYRNIDAVLIPYHDKIKRSDKFINFTGSLIYKLHRDIDKNKIDMFDCIFPKPHIALLIGGASKGRSNLVTEKNIVEISQNLSRICKKMGGSILVTTSRRSPSNTIEILKKNIECSAYYYIYKNDDLQNPYYEILNNSEYVLITGDSIAMISESCNLNKSVYVYSDHIKQKKHLSFLKELMRAGCIKFFNKNTKILTKNFYQDINDIDKIREDLMKLIQAGD
jgi:mitochondrial fission protein ELM1